MDSYRARIEEVLLQSVKTGEPHLNELASHLILAGGKRLRPVMAVSAALACRAVNDEVILGGVACELVHLGSLYHDDVMDEAEIRRGVETVNTRWGNLQAILGGDFLLAKASEIAAGLGGEIAALLARTIGKLCQGQIEELTKAYDVTRSVPSYLTSIEGKTASLFSTSARIGGLLAGGNEEEIEALTRYGRAYGMVFQIVDDILDIIATDSELGKRAGHDMYEGVYTLPTILTLQSGTPGGRELTGLLGKVFSADERETVLAIVRSENGILEAIETANLYVQEAQQVCDLLPKSDAAAALRQAPGKLLESVARL